MTRRSQTIAHELVETFPAEPTDGVLYVSMPYASAMHRCLCGCGEEVVTPFGPTDWKMTFDGESVSLHPSIGNWSLSCQSHYWITEGEVHWSRRWSAEQIAAGRARDRHVKASAFGEKVDGDGERNGVATRRLRPGAVWAQLGGLWRRLRPRP